MSAGEILKLTSVSRSFGKLMALSDLSFSIRKGTIHGLIGPNGSGKTTAFNTISGFIKPTAGRVEFDGSDITARHPHQIAKHGLIRTFQIAKIFEDLTVEENVEVGFHLLRKRPQAVARDGDAILVADSTSKMRRGAILAFLDLEPYARKPAGVLPGGHTRLLTIAMALASNPKLLMLDEPLAGLHPTEKAIVASRISKLRDLGITLLIVEHDIKSIMSVSDRITVLNFGRKIAEGSPAEIANDPSVIDSYLGVKNDE